MVKRVGAAVGNSLVGSLLRANDGTLLGAELAVDGCSLAPIVGPNEGEWLGKKLGAVDGV